VVFVGATVVVVVVVDAGSLSSVEYFTLGRSGFQIRRVRASAAAMRVPKGDQARARTMLPVEGGGGGGWKREDELRRDCCCAVGAVAASEKIVVLESRKALARRGRGIVRGVDAFVDGDGVEVDGVVDAGGGGWSEVDVDVDIAEGMLRVVESYVGHEAVYCNVLIVVLLL